VTAQACNGNARVLTDRYYTKYTSF